MQHAPALLASNRLEKGSRRLFCGGAWLAFQQGPADSNFEVRRKFRRQRGGGNRAARAWRANYYHKKAASRGYIST